MARAVVKVVQPLVRCLRSSRKLEKLTSSRKLTTVFECRFGKAGNARLKRGCEGPREKPSPFPNLGDVAETKR